MKLKCGEPVEETRVVLHGVRGQQQSARRQALKLRKRLQERQADKIMVENINSIHNTLD